MATFCTNIHLSKAQCSKTMTFKTFTCTRNGKLAMKLFISTVMCSAIWASLSFVVFAWPCPMNVNKESCRASTAVTECRSRISEEHGSFQALDGVRHV